jgi:hypothetical protein
VAARFVSNPTVLIANPTVLIAARSWSAAALWPS